MHPLDGILALTREANLPRIQRPLLQKRLPEPGRFSLPYADVRGITPDADCNCPELPSFIVCDPVQLGDLSARKVSRAKVTSSPPGRPSVLDQHKEFKLVELTQTVFRRTRCLMDLLGRNNGMNGH